MGGHLGSVAGWVVGSDGSRGTKRTGWRDLERTVPSVSFVTSMRDCSGEGLADGDHHDAAGGELLEQRRRDLAGGTGDDDGVEGGFLGPAVEAVGDAGVDGGVTEAGEAGGGGFGEGFDDFDGVDVGGEVGEDGGLIARAGADLEDFGGGFEFELAWSFRRRCRVGR